MRYSMISQEKLARMIDHTKVHPNTTEIDIKKLCAEAKNYGFGCACVTPKNVKLSYKLLESSEVKVAAVVGFPFGANTPRTKAFETHEAIENGASEIDMVLSIGDLKSGHDSEVREDIRGVVEASQCKVVKVILETGLLHREEKIRACLIADEAGADFVKTSTGFGTGGATVEDVALLRNTVGPDMGVKASGGIRDLKTALAMIEAGAIRIGTSHGVRIMEEQKIKEYVEKEKE
jgi:deoxyribose-phosphate aldolase